MSTPLPASEHDHAVELIARVLYVCFLTFAMGVGVGVVLGRVFLP